MNEQMVSINETEMTVREYQGQRVVTFKDINMAHGKKDGTAQTSFKRNKKHFIENVDFVVIHPIGTNCTDRDNHNLSNRQISGIDKIPKTLGLYEFRTTDLLSRMTRGCRNE